MEHAILRAAVSFAGGSRTHRLRGSGGRGTSDAASPTTRNGLEKRFVPAAGTGADRIRLARTRRDGRVPRRKRSHPTPPRRRPKARATSRSRRIRRRWPKRPTASRSPARASASPPDRRAARRTASPRCGSCSRPAQSGKRRFPVRRSPTNRPSAGAGRCST